MNRRSDFTAQLEPTLRFPEFTGEWQEKRLGEIGKFYRGLSYDKSNVRSFGNLVLRSSNIQGGQLILDQDLQFVDKAIGKQQNLRKGDIVICMANGSKKLVGKAAIYKGQYSGSITVGAFCSIFRSNNTLAEYLLQTHQYKKYLNMLLTGTNINNLKSSDLEKLKFILPSNEEEQQKIAAFLAVVDKRVALLERKVQQLEAYKRGVMQRLFSQQLRFTRPDGSHFPVWQERRLRDVADVIGGGTPDTKNPRYWGDDIVWLTPSEVKNKYIDDSIRKISHEGLLESSAKILPINTVILTSRATVGDVAIARKELATNQGFQSLVPHKSEDSEFLYYLVTTNKKEFLRRASGSTFLEISNRDVKSIPVRIPILAEQQKIAAFLSALDEKIALTRRQLDKTKQFKKGLLQRMFV